LRQLLGLTAAAAFVAAATAALPTQAGSIALFLAMLIVPGLLGVLALVGGAQARTFCLGAAVPIVFCLYAVGWAFGWVIFNASSFQQLTLWFHNNGEVIKSVILGSWICGGLAGLICVVARRMLER
jgi:hypothetical protein